MDIRKKQHAKLPAAAKAAVALIKKERPCSTDTTKERVGYGRKPQFKLDNIIETFENQWLESRVLKLYRELPPTTKTYRAKVESLVRDFKARHKEVTND